MDKPKINSIDIYEIVKKKNFDEKQLVISLYPLGVFVNEEIFQEKIIDLTSIIIMDLNGNGIFDIDDLFILLNDSLAMANLIESIIIIIGSLPGKILLNHDMEDLILKIIIYMIFIKVPILTKQNLLKREKKSALSFAFKFYNVIETSGIILEKTSKIVNLLYTKNWKTIILSLICACSASLIEKEKEKIANEKLIKSSRKFKSDKERNLYKRKIDLLEKRIIFTI